MNWTENIPTETGYYRVRRECTKSYHVVALLENGRFYFADGASDGCTPEQLATLQYQFGSRVEFHDTLADYRCNYGFFEQAFLAAMEGDWANSQGSAEVDEVHRSTHFALRSRLYRTAATEAVKVMAEATQ